MGGYGDRPNLENRWWVDQGKAERGIPQERPPATYGNRFFRTGAGYDQTRAQRRLTDLNLKWFDEAGAVPGKWALLSLLEGPRFPRERLERVKRVLPFPPGGRGVLVDSGPSSLRAILTGDPPYQRLVEIRLGGDNSFDAWVHSEWVREAVFRSFDDALRRLPALVRDYVLGERAKPLL